MGSNLGNLGGTGNLNKTYLVDTPQSFSEISLHSCHNIQEICKIFSFYQVKQYLH